MADLVLDSNTISLKAKSIFIRTNILTPILLEGEDRVRWIPGVVIKLIRTNSSGDGKKFSYVIAGIEAEKDNAYENTYETLTFDHVGVQSPERFVLDWRDRVVIPGLFDMHFHWVQDDVRISPRNSLLQWLRDSAWPVEAKYVDPEYSDKKAAEFFPRILRAGTLGGMVYSTIHEHSLEAAFAHAPDSFKIGNVVMTMNAPEYLSQNPEDARAICEKYARSRRESYIFTPRFALNVAPDLMKWGAKLAKRYDLYIQTHLSETKEEVEQTLRTFRRIDGFEDIKNYTEIYDRCGLLGPRTILGHSIYVDNEERALISRRRAWVAHCPTSNAPLKEGGLGSGLFDFAALEQAGGNWALGSDIGGGPYVSMFDVMRGFVEQNRRIGRSEASYEKALIHATIMGARFMGLGETHGAIENGRAGNLVAVQLSKNIYPESASPEIILEDLIRPCVENRERCDVLPRSIIFNDLLLGDI